MPASQRRRDLAGISGRRIWASPSETSGWAGTASIRHTAECSGKNGPIHGAEYLIFYIWGDDHIRSLLRCRHAITYKSGNDQGGAMFHGNFWSNLEMDLETGRFVEKENLLATPSALYHMTDPQFMVDHLKDDLALQLYAYKLGYIWELDQERSANWRPGWIIPWDWSQESARARQVGELLDRYSLRATQFILEKAREFSRQNEKKLLVVLFDPYRAMTEMLAKRDAIRPGDRRLPEQREIRLLRHERSPSSGFQEVQPLLRCSIRNCISSATTTLAGNHFFAYSIKDTVVKWLDPKPITYRNASPESIEFKGYLAGYR